MAENREVQEVSQYEQIPEEKEHELVNRDEFGELNTGNVQAIQERQENQVSRNNNQEQAGSSNIPPAIRGNNFQAQAGIRNDPPANVQQDGSQEGNGGSQGGRGAYGRRGGQGPGSPNRGVGGRGRGGIQSQGRGGAHERRGGQGVGGRGRGGGQGFGQGFGAPNRGVGGRGRGGFYEGFVGYGPSQGGHNGVGGYGRYHQRRGQVNNGPYNGAGGHQPDFNRGPSLFDMISRSENYTSEATQPLHSAQFQFPTLPTGPFARAMSQVTCNPTTANQGTVSEKIFSREMFEQLQMALTVQLGLNGPQQVKERALHNVLSSASARVDIKQILQSRAELYGDELDPKWFQQAVDLGGKASTTKKRNQARSQLAGAPLLVAQLTSLEFRKKVLEGDNGLVQNLHMGTWTTVAELLKVFGKIPPLSLLYLCNPEFGKYLSEHMLQHADDLDFVQDILSATAVSTALNPILNSVIAGFGRRKSYRRFKYGQLNMHFDRLRYAESETKNDHDIKGKEAQGTPKKRNVDSSLPCRWFQKQGGCRFRTKMCLFAHKCTICDMPGHGAIKCRTRSSNTATESVAAEERRRPPNPRTRRERANGQ